MKEERKERESSFSRCYDFNSFSAFCILRETNFIYTWTKYFVVLKDVTLLFFDQHDTHKLKMRVALEPSFRAQEVELVTFSDFLGGKSIAKKRGLGYPFSVSSSTLDFILAAENSEDQKKWISLVNQEIMSTPTALFDCPQRRLALFSKKSDKKEKEQSATTELNTSGLAKASVEGVLVKKKSNRKKKKGSKRKPKVEYENVIDIKEKKTKTKVKEAVRYENEILKEHKTKKKVTRVHTQHNNNTLKLLQDSYLELDNYQSPGKEKDLTNRTFEDANEKDTEEREEERYTDDPSGAYSQYNYFELPYSPRETKQKYDAYYDPSLAYSETEQITDTYGDLPPDASDEELSFVDQMDCCTEYMQLHSDKKRYYGHERWNWNERFLKAIAKLKVLEASKNFHHTSMEEKVKIYDDLFACSQDFLSVVTHYGKIIISEYYLPNSNKTIKPVEWKGIAGGVKYVVHNVVFKFAVDSRNLYGSDYAAAKVAGHELKGAMAYYNLGLDFCVPLMALLDHRGFRLFAVAKIPINETTLVSGTNDAGKHVHSSSEEFTVLLKEASEKLKLAPHVVLGKTLYSVADLEGHIGTDGRFYLLDFARVLPPIAHVNGTENRHLYELFRQEFLQIYDKPLCPDSFSNFIRNDPDRQQHNDNIIEATQHLHDVFIPKIVTVLNSVIQDPHELFLNFDVCDTLHSQGINLRYLGKIREKLTNASMRTLLLIEMCARIMKNIMRFALRKTAKTNKIPLAEPFKKCIIKQLIFFFAFKRTRSQMFWTKTIKELIESKYNGGLNGDEKHEDFVILLHSLHIGISADALLKDIVKVQWKHIPKEETLQLTALHVLFVRFAEITGITFREGFVLDLTSNVKGNPFEYLDLISLDEKVKHMNVFTHVQAEVYKNAGVNTYSGKAKRQLFQDAIHLYEKFLKSTSITSSIVSSSQIWYAQTIFHLAFSYMDDRSIMIVLLKKADQAFRKALISNTNHPETVYFYYATFLINVGNFRKAEHYLLKSLECNFFYFSAWLRYGELLAKTNNLSDAECCYARARDAQNYN